MLGWLLVGWVGCAGGDKGSDGPDPDGETDTDAGEDTDAAPTVRDVRSWDFEAPLLVPGDWASWVSSVVPPDRMGFRGDGSDIGILHPLQAQLLVASPLEAPADGSQVVYLNVQPYGVAMDVPGVLVFDVDVEDATVAGVDYEVSFALGRRLDLGFPGVAVSLVRDDGDMLNEEDSAIVGAPTAGQWATVTLRTASSRAGDLLKLIVTVENGALAQEQALFDALHVRTR